MLDNYYLKSPRNQKFYKVLLIFGCCYGLACNNWWSMDFNPLLNRFATFHGIACVVFTPIALFLLLLEFIEYKNLDFSTLGIMFSILPVAMVVGIKMSSAKSKSYKKLMRNFMEKIHLHSFYTSQKDNFVKMVLLEVEKYTRITFYFLGGFLLVDWISWVVVPVISNIHNRELIMNKSITLRTCLYFWVPFDYHYNFDNWVPMHCFGSYLAANGCAIVAIFDTINFAFVFHLIGHIKILKHTIKVRFSDKNMSDDEQKMRLIEIFKAYNFIVNTFDEMQSAFGINVTGNYLQNLLEDSLLLYEMMFAETGDKISYGLMFIVYVGELITMSFILEEVRRQSEDLPEVLYCIPWEKMSVSNQHVFRLILLRVQPMLCFKAAGGMIAGVRPMMSILKSTFSYYIMLKSSVET